MVLEGAKSLHFPRDIIWLHLITSQAGYTIAFDTFFLNSQPFPWSQNNKTFSEILALLSLNFVINRVFSYALLYKIHRIYEFGYATYIFTL